MSDKKTIKLSETMAIAVKGLRSGQTLDKNRFKEGGHLRPSLRYIPHGTLRSLLKNEIIVPDQMSSGALYTSYQLTELGKTINLDQLD